VSEEHRGRERWGIGTEVRELMVNRGSCQIRIRGKEWGLMEVVRGRSDCGAGGEEWGEEKRYR